MEINIGAVIVDEEITLGSVQLDATKVYPELEDLVVTPTAEDQVFESEKYGYDKVTVKGTKLEEDLSAELTEQDKLITNQDITIDDIIETLEHKIAGTDLSTELNEQNTLLATQEILIQQIIEALREKTPEQTSTIEEIEQLLVSHFENKTVEEVER